MIANERLQQQTSNGFGFSTVSSLPFANYLEADIMSIQQKRNICIDCGKLIWIPSIRCKSCTAKIRKPSKITRQKMSESQRGDKAHSWKGDKVGYYGLHDRIRKIKPKPKLCVRCNKKPPYDLANISQEYKSDVNDFEWLCRKCHMEKDDRFKFRGKI